MTRSRFSRRAVLTAAASLPLVSLLRSSGARAAGQVAPLRLVTVFTPFQVPEVLFHPRTPSGGPAVAGGPMALDYANSALASLARYQSNLIVFRGLKYGQALNGHHSGASVFTGSTAANAVDGAQPTTTGSSLEQYLFSRLAQPGSLTPLVAGLVSYSFGDHNKDDTVSFAQGVPQGQVSNPGDLLSTYFSNYHPPSSGIDAGVPDPTAARVLARRQKALSVAQGGLAKMSGRVPSTSTSGKALGQHQTALQSLSNSLGPVGGAGDAGVPGPVMGCTPPTSAQVVADPSCDNGSPDLTKLAQDSGSFARVITEAFACDLTRFASYKMSSASFSIIANEMPGVPAGEFHARVSHSNGSTGSAPGDALDVQLAAFKDFWHAQVAVLMDQLAMTADPYAPTQSLLDNTVILIGSEGPIQAPGGDPHGNGQGDQLFIVAGGGVGTGFKMGQLVDARSGGGMNHNALLTNLVNAFETNQQAFNPAYTPHLLTQYGDFTFPVSPTNWLK
jgi:hypothetical protein